MAKQKSAYAIKLLDPRWQRLRLEILNRDEWACQACGDKDATLHVHHKEYKFGKDPWEYDDGDLITYCADCHETAERTRSEIRLKCNQLDLSKQSMLLDILGYINDCSDETAERWLYSIRELMHDVAKEDASNGAYKAELAIRIA